MFHNVYGTPTDFGDRSQVIPALIRKAVNYPDEPFNVWGSGFQSRAFIHASDIIDAMMSALEYGWGHGYIQIGPSYSTTIKDIAEKIVKISGKDIDIFFDPSKPEGDKARCADYSKAQEVLGWNPKVSLDEGLSQAYSWIEKQIKSCR
jgi:GDP-D-mannose 3',5'-epimerase